MYLYTTPVPGMQSVDRLIDNYEEFKVKREVAKRALSQQKASKNKQDKLDFLKKFV